MTQIDGQNIEDLGLVLIKYKNLYSMPSRLGSPFYDWGVELQPLVLEEDIDWNANFISVDCLFDPRKGVSLEESLFNLRNLKETQLATDYGTFDVTLISVTEVDIKGAGFASITINFEQPVKNFDAVTLPAPIGGGGFGIDGYSFERDFGIHVARTRYLNNVPEYQISNETVHRVPKLRTDLRKWGQVRAKCVVPLEDVGGVLRLEKLLSTPGLKKLGHQGFSYDCFLSEGFAVEFFRDHAEFTILLNVGSRDATIEVRGNGIKISQQDFSPDFADGTRYEATDIRGAGRSQQFTIHNLAGAGTLTISSISVQGADFSLSGSPSGGIAPGGTMNFTVNFAPSTKGGKTGTVIINNSDLLFTPYSFKVAGQAWDSSDVADIRAGINGEVVLNGDMTPAGQADFGDVESDGKTKSRVLSILNQGNLSAVVKSITIIGGSHFSLTKPFEQRTISPGGSATSILKFTPTTNGDQFSIISVLWNNGRDAGDLTYEFRVRGNGVEPAFVPAILVEYGGQEIPDGATYNNNYGTYYPDREEKKESTTRIFRITNIGGENITEAYLSGSSAFSIASIKELPVTPGNFEDIAVRFSPHTAGEHLTTLHVKTATQSYTCGFRGVATSAPEVMSAVITGNGRVVQTGLIGVTNYLNGTDFGMLDKNIEPWLLQAFVVRNTGNVAWNITDNAAVSLTKAIGFDVYIFSAPGVVQPNGTFAFTIRFDGGNMNSGIFIDSVVLEIPPNVVIGSAEAITTTFTIMGQVNNTGLL